MDASSCQYGKLIRCTRNLLLDNKLSQSVVTSANKEHLLSRSFWGSGIQEWLSCTVLVWESLIQLQSRWWVRLWSSEGLIGTGGATLKMVPSHSWWQEAMLSCHVILFIDLLECPRDTVADFPQVSDPSKRVREELQCC